MKRIIVTSIEWDVDENYEGSAMETELPDEVSMEVDDDFDAAGYADEVAARLSDEYGWCVRQFFVEEVA